MDYQYLRLRSENRVGWLEYNRPPINAFNWEMLREMPAALEALQKDSQVRVIVVASSGGERGFVAESKPLTLKRQPGPPPPRKKPQCDDAHRRGHQDAP